MAKEKEKKQDKPKPRYRLVNQMPQKLIVNVVIPTIQESIELSTGEKSKFFDTSELGPHVETLRKARRLYVERA